jgi:hypothetical protein
MISRFLLIAAVLFTSCTSVKVAVPDQFGSGATKMPVKGLNGWMINQQLTFGNYQTSKIKRGWDFTSAVQWTKMRISPEEMILRVFNIETDRRNLTQRNKFQYTLHDGTLAAEVYATEKFKESQLVYKSNNPHIGSASATKGYEYAFTAAILPLAEKDNDPWSLVLINRYDRQKDTARRLFDKPYVEEEGYATNGKESIAIRPLRLDKVTTKGGKDTKVFGGPVLTGYEILWDGGVVAIVDILDNNVWIYNDLEPSEKLILSSIASAIMLKRMQDVEKDRDNIVD